MLLRLKIVTPERLVLEEDVYSVTLPAEGGEITVLPDHIPYIGSLRSGEIFFRRRNVRFARGKATETQNRTILSALACTRWLAATGARHITSSLHPLRISTAKYVT